MLENVKSFINNHFDFKFYSSTWVALLFGLLITPAVMFLPARCGYENGLLENIQMVVLFLTLVLCFIPKVNKTFFKFVAFFIIIFILREVNCGRTLFFPIPNTENAFYSWKDIKYGYLVNPIYGCYIAFVALFFFFKKLYVDMWRMIKDIKLPVWNIFFMLIAACGGEVAEKMASNFVLEEAFELFFYVSFASIIYLYTRHKNFAVEVSNK